MQLRDGLEDQVNQHGRQAHGRLVEQEDVWTGHQRAPHGQHLLLAAGKRAGQLRAPLAQAGKEREDALQVLCDGGLVVAREGAHFEVFHDGQHGKHVPAFGHQHDAFFDDAVRREGTQVFAAQAHGAVARLEQAADRLQGRALAGAVRADERDDLALVDVERHALERVNVAVVGVDVGNVKHGR